MTLPSAVTGIGSRAMWQIVGTTSVSHTVRSMGDTSLHARPLHHQGAAQRAEPRGRLARPEDLTVLIRELFPDGVDHVTYAIPVQTQHPCVLFTEHHGVGAEPRIRIAVGEERVDDALLHLGVLGFGDDGRRVPPYKVDVDPARPLRYGTRLDRVDFVDWSRIAFVEVVRRFGLKGE